MDKLAESAVLGVLHPQNFLFACFQLITLDLALSYLINVSAFL